MSVFGPTVLAVICLFTAVHRTRGMDHDAYRRVVEMAMKPRVAGQNETEMADIQNAIVELVIIHLSMNTGRPYPIGSATGLFGRRRRRFASFGGGWGSSWDSGYNSGWSGSSNNNFGRNNNFGSKNTGYGSNFHNPWISDPWQSDNNNQNYNNHPNNNNNNNYPSKTFTTNNKFTSDIKNEEEEQNLKIVSCPFQANLSEIYHLNATHEGYPSLDIGHELFFRSLVGSDLFFFCLIRRAILPGTPPRVSVDQNFVTANSTCPSQDLELFSYTYQDSQYGGRCWLIQGFQEKVTFSICKTKGCVNCQMKKKDDQEKENEKKKQHPYHRPQNPYNDHPDDYRSEMKQSNNVTVNHCFVEYRTIQVVSYCEHRPVNNRIVYDRLVIPLFCTCKTIDCQVREQKH